MKLEIITKRSKVSYFRLTFVVPETQEEWIITVTINNIPPRPRKILSSHEFRINPKTLWLGQRLLEQAELKKGSIIEPEVFGLTDIENFRRAASMYLESCIRRRVNLHHLERTLEAARAFIDGGVI